jgi:hypothetical protein
MQWPVEDLPARIALVAGRLPALLDLVLRF